MTHWHPQLLTECLGAAWLGWLTGALALGMLVWYGLIARMWWDSSCGAGVAGRKVWRLLMLIFIVCAIAGYASWILALFAPKIAVPLRIIALAAQNVICPVFWSIAHRCKFEMLGIYESVGETVFRHGLEMGQMTDAEVASLARRACAEGLARLG